MESKTPRYDIGKLAKELEFDIEDVKILFSKYFIEIKENISQMQEYFSHKDWDMLERVVHNIKGVSYIAHIH
jgi:hypothetical protein